MNKNCYQTYKNLTKEEQSALDDLEKDKTIVIKQADKGVATVVMNKCDYIKECDRQLSDNMFYEKHPRDPTEGIRNSIHEALSLLLQNGEISENEYNFLKVDCPTITIFYTLPKIHKSLENPPGQPIVASISSLTSNLSIFIDSIIRPAAEDLSLRIQDT